MRINNNVTAINSHRQYTINNGNIGKTVEKLSSGYRVNRAGDDAAGLAISEKMRNQIRGLNMASKNSQDGISLVQTAEGALQTAHSVLQRMRELAVQSANGTNQSIDREALDLEFQQLKSELNDLERVKFNGITLIKTTASATPVTESITIQSGANSKDITTVEIQHLKMDELASISGTNGDLARNQLNVLSNMINAVSSARAGLGAIQNRLEYKIQNLDISAENLQAAESRIRDADMAKMMTDFTRNNILFQASTAMLAQANALPQGVLQLLG